MISTNCACSDRVSVVWLNLQISPQPACLPPHSAVRSSAVQYPVAAVKDSSKCKRVLQRFAGFNWQTQLEQCSMASNLNFKLQALFGEWVWAEWYFHLSYSVLSLRRSCLCPSLSAPPRSSWFDAIKLPGCEDDWTHPYHLSISPSTLQTSASKSR